MAAMNVDELPEGEEKRQAVQAMFDTIAPRYDLVNRIMTFRLDVRWRRRTVAAMALPAGSLVLDLACGTGDFCIDLQKGGLRPVGVDLSMGMLAASRADAPLLHGDILALPIGNGVADGATCGFALRNLVELPGFFDELARVVRPGGRIGLLEVGDPQNRLIKTGYGVYFGKVVPFIGGLLSDRNAYRYLPKSASYLPPSAELLARLAEAGFIDVERELLTAGCAQLITATRA
ncbi:MAG: ubiquinone/menaquinone biosynthesis methyltransferase [Acidimicrobiales bacterium]|nr:ubiquinone/menaquinone biosynthesis methyltransferase [Acidimicrobiales bacterium]